MNDSNTQMRRSFSMPVKPLHLEPKTLKRSEEKETVYATDDSDGEYDDDANYLRQRSSPAIVTETSRCDDAEHPTLERGLPKHLRSIRDFIASSMVLIASILRKSDANENENENQNQNQNQNENENQNQNENGNENESSVQGSAAETCPIRTKDINGQMNKNYYDLAPEGEKSNEAASAEEQSKEVEQSNENERERAVFSL